MDFAYPTGEKAVSVRITAPQLVFELQHAIVEDLENPDEIMQNMRITRATANCFGDDVALTMELYPTAQAKTILLSAIVHNVENCRHA